MYFFGPNRPKWHIELWVTLIKIAHCLTYTKGLWREWSNSKHCKIMSRPISSDDPFGPLLFFQHHCDFMASQTVQLAHEFFIKLLSQFFIFTLKPTDYNDDKLWRFYDTRIVKSKMYDSTFDSLSLSKRNLDLFLESSLWESKNKMACIVTHCAFSSNLFHGQIDQKCIHQMSFLEGIKFNP